jgi:hypothetical protein
MGVNISIIINPLLRNMFIANDIVIDVWLYMDIPKAWSDLKNCPY